MGVSVLFWVFFPHDVACHGLADKSTRPKLKCFWSSECGLCSQYKVHFTQPHASLYTYANVDLILILSLFCFYSLLFITFWQQLPLFLYTFSNCGPFSRTVDPYIVLFCYRSPVWMCIPTPRIKLHNQKTEFQWKPAGLLAWYRRFITTWFNYQSGTQAAPICLLWDVDST